jgi:hypothetical protein
MCVSARYIFFNQVNSRNSESVEPWHFCDNGAVSFVSYQLAKRHNIEVTTSIANLLYKSLILSLMSGLTQVLTLPPC